MSPLYSLIIPWLTKFFLDWIPSNFPLSVHISYSNHWHLFFTFSWYGLTLVLSTKPLYDIFCYLFIYIYSNIIINNIDANSIPCGIPNKKWYSSDVCVCVCMIRNHTKHFIFSPRVYFSHTPASQPSWGLLGPGVRAQRVPSLPQVISPHSYWWKKKKNRHGGNVIGCIIKEIRIWRIMIYEKIKTLLFFFLFIVRRFKKLWCTFLY